MIDADYQPLNYGDQRHQPILIARLHYPESQWGEDISIYVTPYGEGLTFEAIDFYGNDIVLEPQFSDQPLSLRAVIYMIENMRPADDNFSGNLELTLMGIPEVTSDFYTGLSLYFLEKRKKLGLE